MTPVCYASGLRDLLIEALFRGQPGDRFTPGFGAPLARGSVGFRSFRSLRLFRFDGMMAMRKS